MIHLTLLTLTPTWLQLSQPLITLSWAMLFNSLLHYCTLATCHSLFIKLSWPNCLCNLPLNFLLSRPIAKTRLLALNFDYLKLQCAPSYALKHYYFNNVVASTNAHSLLFHTFHDLTYFESHSSTKSTFHTCAWTNKRLQNYLSFTFVSKFKK